MTFPGRLPPEECYPAGIAGVTSRFVGTRSGARVRVLEAGARPGDGLGTVLLVHGWGCHAYVFRHLIPALAGAGYHVLAPDLQGHGQSDKPLSDARRFALDGMADHLAEIMDALGLRAVAALVGHSLGGAVALRLALRAPERVGRLVLFAPVGLGRVSMYRLARALSPRALMPVLPHLAPRWLFRFIMRMAYGRAYRFSDRDLDEYWAPSRSPEFVRALWHLLKGFDWEPRTPAELRTLRVPTLVVFGREDRVVSPRRSAELVGAIPGVRLEMVPGSGHVVPEENPARAAALLLDFLAQRRPDVRSA